MAATIHSVANGPNAIEMMNQIHPGRPLHCA